MGYIGKVPADVLIDPHVDSASIVDSTIVTADIANDAVTSAKLAQNSVDSSELIDGSVDNSHLAGSIAMNKTLLSAGTGLTLSTNTLSVDAAQTQITSVGTIGTGVWQGTKVASAYLDDDTAHLSGSTFTGALISDYNGGRNLKITNTSDNEGIWIDNNSSSLTSALINLHGYNSSDMANFMFLHGYDSNASATKFKILGDGSATFAGNITQSASGNLRHTISAGGSGEASLLIQANNSTGDSFIRWETNSTTFCMGFDNSDGDKFILSAGSDPHSNSVINIQPGGSSIAVDKPLSFTDVVIGETNSHISYTAGQGTDTVTGGAFRAPGSDIVTGRIFFQGYQNGATDLVGINNESDKLVVYNYTDNAYMLKFDHGGSADFTGNVGINGDRYMLMESDANKGYLGKDDWATSGGSADNINLGCYGGQVKITAGSNSSSTSNIVCLTDKSTHFNNFINVEGDVQHKASSGSGVTVYKLWQQNGGYTGDIDIVCTASGWKSFIYDLCVIGHGGGGNWRGFAYHNGGITHGYQSVTNNNGAVGSMSLTTSGQSMTFSIPLSSTLTHVLIEFTLSTGGGDLITQDDISISID
tara:strand:- start:174 stop:1937 length:1764 start_codon:yes stop_codon:yes gene_type:complete